MTSKPVFAIVPGAFHFEPTWDHFVKELTSAGYEAQVASLSSTKNASNGLQEDIAKIRNSLVIPLLDAGKDVVLIFHSFAGLPGSASLSGLTKSERQSQGLSGGLIGVIFVAAFIPQPGDSLKAVLGGKWEPWQTEDTESGLLNVTGDAKQVFYADVPDATAQPMIKALVGHSVLAMTSPCPPVHVADPAFNGRRGYVRCSEDQAIPVFAQDGMVKGSGVDWIVKEMVSSHSPFASKPAELWNHVKDLAESFQKA